MSPRADFACLGPRCKQADGEAAVYELPVGSTRCPVCGSKRVRQLFNKIGVIGLRPMQPEADWRLTSSSPLQRSKALLQDGFDAQYKRKASSREMPTWGTADREREVAMQGGRKFIVPSRQELAGMFGLGGKGKPLTQMEVMREIRQDRLSVPSVLHQLNQKPVPTVVVGRPR